MSERKKAWLQVLLVLLVGVGAVGLSEWIASLAESPAPENPGEEHVVSVAAERIEPTSHAIVFSATGAVRVESYVDLIPQVSGRIVDADDAVRTGAHFTKGTVLFRIDPKDYELAAADRRAAISQARRALKLQRAESETAKRQWRRLHPDEDPPPLVAKTPQVEEARATLEAAESGLTQANLDLERSRFSLPFDGRVVESSIEKGQFVSAGRSYGRVYRDDALEVKAPVTARQRKWLLAADRPEVTLHVLKDGTRAAYRGSFARMAAEAEPRTRLFEAIFSFVDPPASAAPGEFVEVEVRGPELNDVWLLPLGALQAQDKVWVIDDENRLKEISPTIINVTEAHVVAQSNGKPITVVSEALRSATSGTKVEVRDGQ